MENQDFHARSSAEDIHYRRSGFSIAGIMAFVYIALLIRGNQQLLLLITVVITALGAWYEVWLLRKAVDFLIRSGNVIHRFTNPLLFGMIYILSVIPTAVALKLLGKDVLGLKYDRKAQTYWKSRPSGEAGNDSFHNQF